MIDGMSRVLGKSMSKYVITRFFSRLAMDFCIDFFLKKLYQILNLKFSEKLDVNL
jgi:hypothetical protein